MMIPSAARTVAFVALLLSGVASAAADDGFTRLGTEQQLNTFTFGPQKTPAVAWLGGTRFAVVWSSPLQASSQGGAIVARLVENGLPISGEILVAEGTPGPPFESVDEPDVAAAADGSFVVSWQVRRATSPIRAVSYRRFASSGAPTGGAIVVDRSQTNEFPRIASDAAGNLVLVWEGEDGAGLGIVARRFDLQDTSMGGTFVVNAYVTGSQQAPAVAATPDGGFRVAWYDFSRLGDGDLFSRLFDATGQPVGDDVQLNELTAGVQAEPALAIATDGKFVATWSSFTGTADLHDIRGRAFAADGSPLGSEFAVNAFTPGDQTQPRLAIEGTDAALFVWQSAAAGHIGIFGRLFDLTGRPQGDEQQVDSFGLGRLTSPSVASNAAGTFLAAWDSYEQDGSVEGIFARGLERRRATVEVPALGYPALIALAVLLALAALRAQRSSRLRLAIPDLTPTPAPRETGRSAASRPTSPAPPGYESPPPGRSSVP